jgi:hypothetical protein
LIHKAKTKEPKTEVQQHRTGLAGLTGEEHWSDQCGATQFGDFEVEGTRQDRKACVAAKQLCGRWASVRWNKDKDF